MSKWIRSIRVVFSIDLMRTLVFGVMGELASLRGLKPRTVFIIRLDVLGRLRTRMDRQFNVASTRRASLWGASQQDIISGSTASPTCCCPGARPASYPTDPLPRPRGGGDLIGGGLVVPWPGTHRGHWSLELLASRAGVQRGGKAQTLYSMPLDAVWARTTRWANLTQQTLTGLAAPSHIRRILALMAVMASQLSLW